MHFAFLAPIAFVDLGFRLQYRFSEQRGQETGALPRRLSGEVMSSGNVVGAGIALAAGAVATYKAVDKYLQSRRVSVAVLGEAGVGKTTLLRILHGLDEGDPEPTNTPQKYPSITTRVDGRKVRFNSGYDVSGSSSAWSDWQEEVQHGYVIYLVNARQLAEEDGFTPTERPPNPMGSQSRVLQDAQQIARMFEELKLEDYRCVFAVTHRDRDPRFGPSTREAEYNEQIGDQLKNAVFTLGGSRHVSVTSGSLVPFAPGSRLKDDIIRRLLPKR